MNCYVYVNFHLEKVILLNFGDDGSSEATAGK